MGLGGLPPHPPPPDWGSAVSLARGSRPTSGGGAHDLPQKGQILLLCAENFGFFFSNFCPKLSKMAFDSRAENGRLHSFQHFGPKALGIVGNFRPKSAENGTMAGCGQFFFGLAQSAGPKTSQSVHTIVQGGGGCPPCWTGGGDPTNCPYIKPCWNPPRRCGPQEHPAI